MRLVKFGGNGDLNDLSLVEFTDRNIPPYAIISHTWGESSEEVTFQDIISGIGKNKAGYRKLRFCEVQALVDGLQYFWIDTCCIDKSSSAELQEAINSMFRWYQNAAVCYVYLSDVSTTAHVWQPPRQTLKPDLQRSRWFTRCWTLQELLAPRTVQFFSCEGKPLGDKQSLRQEIHEITGIPIQALEGQPLSEFTIVERISWTARRESKREEDASYCLLGIFDVHMPVIYGEGRNNAFTRLEREILLTTQGTSRSALHGFFALLSENRADPITAAPHISNTEEPKTDFNGASDTDSESEIISIFSDEEGSASSASSVGPNPVQTVGIREVSRVLLNQEDLKTLYMMAVLKLERRKARVHIRGFLKEYGQNLLREASNGVLEIQAAKFVQQLAGRIADEINWNIAGFETENEQESLKLDNKLEKNDLETWLSSLQPQSADIEEQPANIVEGVDEDEYDNELDNDLQFPNIEKVKGFLLGSEAFKDYVKAMRKWLKVDESQVEDHENHDEDIDNQAINMPVNTYAEEEEEEEEAKRTFVGFATPTTGHSRAGNREGLVAEIQLHSQHDDEQEPRSRSRGPQNRNSVTDLLSGFLNFWHISFYFYDIVELFVPRIRSGYKRLRWRCSCNSVLWGDFPIDDNGALDLLKRELLWWNAASAQRVSSDVTLVSEQTADLATGVSITTNLRSLHSTDQSPESGALRPATLNSQKSTNVTNTSSPEAIHVVDFTFAPKYFEVCVNIGNHAVDHQEIDISRISSDNELFELIWDKYNSSRGIGLRRFFLRPKDVHFVMFSLSRCSQYGAGIHKKPDEFPPQTELDEKRYHYLCPKIRMPANVFLHYLHRARLNVWGEHTEDIWLRRLPKKLKESVRLEMKRANSADQQDSQSAIMDPDLVFGWGVHIIDGPNHAVLGILLAVGIAVAFVISGFIVGFAKTQEQGFGVGNFLLTIMASTMAAIYFQLQDQ